MPRTTRRATVRLRIATALTLGLVAATFGQLSPASAVPPDMPVGLAVNQPDSTTTILSWEHVPNATRYAVIVNGRRISRPYPLRFQTQKLWQWREEPPAFRIALGSCAYVNEPEYDRPGNAYGGGLEIFTSIVRTKPDAMLWLGDNVYLREVDWYTRTGILARYTHSRSIPELQPLLASTHHYATWDDHDFGPNNSDRSWIHKDVSLDAFKLFWGNPGYGVGGKPGDRPRRGPRQAGNVTASWRRRCAHWPGSRCGWCTCPPAERRSTCRCR